MNVIRQIVFIILATFIAIGDTVVFLAREIKSLIVLPVRKISSLSNSFDTVKLSSLHKQKKIKKSKTLYKAPKRPLSETLARGALHVKFKLFQAGRVLRSAILSPVHGVVFLGKKIFVRRDPVIKSKSRRGRKPVVYRPSFLYKFKFFVLGVVMSFLFIFVPLLTIVFISDLPSPANLSMSYIPKTTKIYDRNGILLYEIYANQNRTVVQLDQIPPLLKQATIAIEDQDFYSHPGFDVRGIARAFVSNISTDTRQGGSTITQQLIKSAFLTPEPTIKRKVKELVLAFWAEQQYTKDQILEMYFNYVPYGGTAWGVESASEIYFGKNVNDLTLAESAFLAGLPRAPSIYSPFSGNGDIWKRRQKDVLAAMVRDGYINQRQANDALREELVFKSPDVSIKSPHFVMYVKDLLVQKYGISEVERGGLQVRTSLDLRVQENVEQIVAQHVNENAYLNVQNGASVVTDPRNGDIIAMVGSRDYFDTENDGNVNVATSPRQPGSTIKIVTYTLALENGFTEATLIDDSPLTIASSDGGPSYTPVNYDGSFHGRPTLRNAFANSYNITAVRVAQKLGVDQIIEGGRKMGITTWTNPSRYGLSITLGGGETKMTDMATVFGTIANEGQRVDLDPILSVSDAYGKEVYKKEVTPIQAVDPGVAFIVSDILADNAARSSAFGTSSPLHIPGKRVSVKTGTTDNKRDNWTMGFTDSYVVATWVGNNDNTPMSPQLTSGVTGAAPMWNDIMTYLIEDEPSDPLVVPASVVTRNCFGKTSYFLRGTENSINCRFNPQQAQPPQTR